MKLSKSFIGNYSAVPSLGRRIIQPAHRVTGLAEQIPKLLRIHGQILRGKCPMDRIPSKRFVMMEKIVNSHTKLFNQSYKTKGFEKIKSFVVKKSE